ncbi:MAG: NAD(P)-dependent oxidoreductase [Rubrivivax sp.]
MRPAAREGLSVDILIVESIEPEVLNWLRARHAVRHAPELAWDQRGLRVALEQARSVIVPASVALDGPLVRAAPLLRAVGRISAGVENIDRDACSAAGVEVVRPTAAVADAEAEFVVGALLQMLRRVPVLAAEGMLVGRELGSCTVGIVGMTASAKPLADLLGAFGARVIGYDPGTHQSDALWTRYRVLPYALAELMAASDAVCVLLPYYTRYRAILGESVLQGVREDQVLVCLSHSDLLDDAALARLLVSGRMAAAWLDAAEPGLTAPGRPLHGIQTLMTTPRVAATTRQSRARSAWSVARRIDEVLTLGPARPPFRQTTSASPLGRADAPGSS